MTKKTSTVIAFLVAPLVSAIIGATLTPIEGDWNRNLHSLLGLIPIFYFFSMLAMLLLGSPLFLFFSYFRLVRWWSSIISGILVGALVAFILHFPAQPNLNDILTTVSMGSASALFFWFIWRQGDKG